MLAEGIQVSSWITQLGQKFARLRNGRQHLVARNVLILSVGTGLAQAANILSTPILSWFYSPESFGIMATTMSIIYIVSSVASINYESAIILPKSNEVAADLFFLCCFITALVSVFSFLLSYAYFVIFDPSFYLSSFVFSSFLLIGIFFLSVFNVLNQWAIRVEAYSRTSCSHVARTAGCLVIQFIGTLHTSSAVWLVSGRIVGMIPAIAVLAQSSPTNLFKKHFREQIRASLIAAQNYRQFPLFAAPQRIISLISEELPTLAFASFFGASAAGFYWFSNRLLQMPCGIISQAIGRVFYREAARKIHLNQPVFPTSIKIVVSLGLISIGPAILIGFYAPTLFDFAMGPDWQTAAEFSQWIIIWVYFRFVFSPILSLFIIIDKQKFLLKIDTLFFIIRLPSVLISCLFFDVMTTIILLTLFESFKISLYAGLAIRGAQLNDKRILARR